MEYRLIDSLREDEFDYVHEFEEHSMNIDSRVLPWELNHKKHKILRKCFDLSSFVELSSLIILVKKSWYFHQQMTVIWSKYWNMPNSSSYLIFFSILTISPSFVDESINFFLPKWSAKKALQTRIGQNIF